MQDRITTGILGMDELLRGGIPKHNIVLISGGPGTGKTIFSQKYLYHGLLKGEPGAYVALEEHPLQVRKEMAEFGWDVREYEEKGLFAIVDAFTSGIGEAAEREKYMLTDVDDFSEFIDVVKEALRDTKAVRAVVDSVSTLYITKPLAARELLMNLKRVLTVLGTTALLVSQVNVTEKGFGGPGVEHAVDGIIRLDLNEVEGELKRSLIVWKMRGTSHDMRRHPFDITDKGIIIYPDKVFKV